MDIARASDVRDLAQVIAGTIKDYRESSAIVVRWDDVAMAWEPRPASAPFGVIFLSTNDSDAPAPTDVALQSGDVWRRHPDAS